MTKDCRIDIRLEKEEKEKLKQLAKSAGMSLSKYLKSIGTSGTVVLDTALMTQRKERNCWLGRICGNLHALAKYANYNKADANSAIILARLMEIETEIKGLRFD